MVVKMAVTMAVLRVLARGEVVASVLVAAGATTVAQSRLLPRRSGQAPGE